jgi:hypothetical protein
MASGENYEFCWFVEALKPTNIVISMRGEKILDVGTYCVVTTLAELADALAVNI